jgi:hypothetical protein
MSARATDLRAQPDVTTRTLAAVSVPDPLLISRAIDFAREPAKRWMNSWTRLVRRHEGRGWTVSK